MAMGWRRNFPNNSVCWYSRKRRLTIFWHRYQASWWRTHKSISFWTNSIKRALICTVWWTSRKYEYKKPVNKWRILICKTRGGGNVILLHSSSKSLHSALIATKVTIIQLIFTVTDSTWMTNCTQAQKWRTW